MTFVLNVAFAALLLLKPQSVVNNMSLLNFIYNYEQEAVIFPYKLHMLFVANITGLNATSVTGNSIEIKWKAPPAKLGPYKYIVSF